MNNSATTRTITKIALEYNGNDKGTAEMVASNYILSETAEGQFHEMKTVAERNSKVKKWALTGYISQPDEIGRKLKDEEFLEIATKALDKVGVTANNQFRLDIHNSTKHKHIHFIVNRIDISGKCTVKSHDIGKRFGEAVREVCKERGLLTDVEIGVQKKAEMLKSLTEAIRSENNFDGLISEMKKKGFEVQLSSNVKDGISGMRILLEKDKNHQTERIYKAGYKLSEISNQLKISQIKSLFEVKTAVKEAQKYASNLKEFRENIQQKGFSVKMQYNGEFKANQKNEIQDIWINKVDSNQQKSGLFFKKNLGFSLSVIDSGLGDLVKSLSKSNVNNDASNHLKSETNESLIEIAGGLFGDFLNPTYISQDEDELWKKKRKLRR
ncbi:relaxase/mobilization nuclease domain-containing protein [Chryseobacterium balustinum]|uniref:Relaxase/Mobilisation nuclease domain n=1 Tax=Chryseobacterium balustinum TaxID=246 RepID=A0AAX2IG07_9FLAO|nr:relaxase/mobilization nuclease domain-containing protein [Chryseobacterium balustinum]AZB31804.1 relaxase [Chryseobacterium balustinum]SKC05994.1 Relaxase/Mobilisation nuclease domain-containing protein [Chryseobacterium balustinum]SQA86806.1 Relaxase/Mobilisation nuclease domain [Chryseobacterium balustinum]